jgi:hypothetical protein
MSLCFGFPNIALAFVLFWDELPPTRRLMASQSQSKG